MTAQQLREKLKDLCRFGRLDGPELEPIFNSMADIICEQRQAQQLGQKLESHAERSLIRGGG